MEQVLEGGVPIEGFFKNADTVTYPFKPPVRCEWRPPSRFPEESMSGQKR